MDAPALGSSIAHLNTAATFTPLQALQDTDVAGFVRYAHEQNIIATIEEARKATQDSFYRFLEEREQEDWEERKKRVFEQLGDRVGTGDNKAVNEMKRSMHGKSLLSVSCCFVYVCDFLIKFIRRVLDLHRVSKHKAR